MSGKKIVSTKRKGARRMKKDEATGAPVRPFTQLDTSDGGVTVTTPAAIKKRCQQAVQRAQKLNPTRKAKRAKK